MTQLTPQHGDIVIRQEKCEKRRVYVLYAAPGPAQIAVQSRDDAIAEATTFAKRQHVRVLMAVDGNHDFALLEDFRITDVEKV